VGSVIHIEEVVDGIVMKDTWTVLAFKPDRSILMRARGLYPTYLQLEGTETARGSEISLVLSLGYTTTFLADVCDWLMKRTFLTDRKIASIQQHNKEELLRLEKVV
jgi:hypothetical protein